MVVIALYFFRKLRCFFAMMTNLVVDSYFSSEATVFLVVAELMWLEFSIFLVVVVGLI